MTFYGKVFAQKIKNKTIDDIKQNSPQYTPGIFLYTAR
jgi:hypothetical protein